MAKRQTTQSVGRLPGSGQPATAITRNLAIRAFAPPDGVPEIVIDGIAGVVILNGVAKFRCFSAGTDPDKQEMATIVLRLSMGTPVIVNIHEILGRIIRELNLSAAPQQT